MSNDTHVSKSRLAPSFLPTTAVLEMTYRCNHQCLFCSCPWEAPDSRFTQHGEMSIAEWKAVIDRLTGMGVCNLAFTGGEPLLKEGIGELIEHAALCMSEHIDSVDGALKSRFAVPNLYLLSNGSAVTRDVLAMCKRWDVQLSMSLPGLSTFHEHTQFGDPDAILERFREASALDIPTVVAITVTRKNLGELYETIAAAFLAGARQLLLNRFLPGGRGLRHADALVLGRAEVVEMLDTAEEALRDANRYGSVGTELPKCVVDVDRYERLEVGTRCAAAIGFFVVDPSGFVRTCNHSPHRLSHVRQIDQIKTDPYWRQFTQKDYLPSACGGCESMGACDGGCREAAHILFGAVDAQDPLLQAASAVNP